jgi:hypothetical protein
MPDFQQVLCSPFYFYWAFEVRVRPHTIQLPINFLGIWLVLTLVSSQTESVFHLFFFPFWLNVLPAQFPTWLRKNPTVIGRRLVYDVSVSEGYRKIRQCS